MIEMFVSSHYSTHKHIIPTYQIVAATTMYNFNGHESLWSKSTQSILSIGMNV